MAQVRRIRYPSTDEEEADRWNVASSYEEDWDPDRWSAHETWAATPSGQHIQSKAAPRQQASAKTPSKLPNSK